MWLPDKQLIIDPSKFKKSEKILFCAKDGSEHKGTVIDITYKGLLDGYKYLIELDEPLNGIQRYLTNEKKLKGIKQTKKSKK